MRKLTTSGFICLEDDYRLVYKIAKIEYEEWEDGTFNYIFRPFYNVIDMLPDNLFQGIPGLDLSLKKSVYERKNIIPTFISERTPSEHREDLWVLMEESGMQALNRLEWLIRTNKRYSGDKFFVLPFDGNDTVRYEKQSMYDLVKRSDNIHRKLLEIICFGDYLYTSDIVIDDISRPHYYQILMQIYMHEYDKKKAYKRIGIGKAKDRNAYKGRTKIKIDPLLFDRMANDYLQGKLSADQASSKLKISRSTFFRRLRERK
ncbi:MAG: hypothetical protein E7587_10475 [Ruminococcaceae bacterium]|nr:hypothetical protein [Oscillospiraceae bacterium]